MPPDRGRASRACITCRKQKTRCYESGLSGRPCLRCERLRQRCSFVSSPDGEETVVQTVSAEARISQLERTVGALLERLGEDSNSIITAGSTVQTDARGRILTEKPLRSAVTAATKHEGSSAPPVMAIRDLASDIGLKSPETNSTVFVLDGLVPPDLALTLITIFLKHYGRWVLFDEESDPARLLEKVTKSPLLFCACCLIAVRHTTDSLATNLAPKLYQCARSLVSAALLDSPQPIEFFQASLVLSMWSTTVGQVPLSIDSWLLSGFALQHWQSSPVFEQGSDAQAHAGPTKATLDRWCLWNHICLVHLQYCVGTSRTSMLQASQIARCRVIVGSDHATNYELRMVAEVFLYWTVYENTSGDRTDLLKSIADLQTWKREWQFILDQPRSQFLQMGLHFAHLLLYDQSLKSKTARARESVLTEMIRHSTSLIRLAIDTADDRTRHLSDHIYHMITFAAIIICRLWSGYEEQLSICCDVAELDGLIRRLVGWLRSIGLAGHAAHVLGGIVEGLYRKVSAEVSPVSAGGNEGERRFQSEGQGEGEGEAWMAGDLAGYFPEFLGVETTGDGSWDLLPSWEFSNT